MTPKQLSAVPCSTCGVAAGKRCVLHSGALRGEPHVDRRLTAAEAVEMKRSTNRYTPGKSKIRVLLDCCSWVAPLRKAKEFSQTMNVARSRSGLRSEALTSEIWALRRSAGSLVAFGRPQQTLLFLKTCRSQVGFRERSRLAFVEEGVFGPLGSNRPPPALSDCAFHLFL